MKTLCLLMPALAVCAAPAFAYVTVSTPGDNATVTSPFVVSAAASPCSNQAISAMGYSIDNSTSTTIFKGAKFSANMIASSGKHVLHVKSWGDQGAACVTTVSITVGTAAPALVPSGAKTVGGIQVLKNWQAAYDTGTGSGSASGNMSLVNSPSVSGTAREFLTTFSNYGGERYSVNVGTDTTSTSFLLDARIYVAGPSTDIANVEMDLNQVMSNGQTVIFGFQCDGWSGTWDYTINAGSPQNPVDKWMHSTQSCNPHNWTTNAWHHIQISYSRDQNGNVTYKSVWFDGVQHEINATAMSAFALGWGPALLLNFQVDGATSTAGAAMMYLDNVTLYRW